MARVVSFAVLLLTLLCGVSTAASAQVGRISQHALDTAARMIAVGIGRGETREYVRKIMARLR